MSNSMQDQLLKAGLVNEKKLKQHKRAKKKQAKQPKGEEQVSEAALHAHEAREERARRDRERNEALRLEAEQKAIAGQIRQMIETNRINRSRGSATYQFAAGGRVKKILVLDEQSEQLARGQIAVVALDGQFELIPAPVAAKIRERDAAAVLVLHQKSDQHDDEDDPYADYPIPDDLMW